MGSMSAEAAGARYTFGEELANALTHGLGPVLGGGLLLLHHPLGLSIHGSPLQGRRDLNPQPPVLETGALPIELRT